MTEAFFAFEDWQQRFSDERVDEAIADLRRVSGVANFQKGRHKIDKVSHVVSDGTWFGFQPFGPVNDQRR